MSEESEIPVSVESIRKTYGSLTAVDRLSFKVESGEVYSLLGPNGAGKTTTVEIIEGLRKADSGKVSVLGTDPWSSPGWIRKAVGIMPQDFRFIERITPVEAIKYYSTLFGVPDRSGELVELVELGGARNNQFQNLSGGEKQKVGICLALINDPKLVFLDEPTTGLDPISRRKIWSLIKKLKEEGKTVVLTTHYLEEAQMLADRVGIVNTGKMLVEGTPRSIIEKMGKGRRLLVSKSPELLSYVKDILKLKVDEIEEGLQIQISDNGNIMDIFTFLDQNKIGIERFSLLEDSLEDVFIDLIGKKGEEQ